MKRRNHRVDNLEFDPRVIEGLRAENQGTTADRVFRIETRVERAHLTLLRGSKPLPRVSPPA